MYASDSSKDVLRVSPVACNNNLRMINQQRHAACDSARSLVLSAIFGIRESEMHCLHAKMLLVALSVARIKGHKDETPPADRIQCQGH